MQASVLARCYLTTIVAILVVGQGYHVPLTLLSQGTQVIVGFEVPKPIQIMMCAAWNPTAWVLGLGFPVLQ